MILEGKAHKFGDNVNTDVIYPGKYTYQQLSPEDMAKHAMEDIDTEFYKKVSPGDVIVAGKNFGCGSSREQAAECLRHAGVGALVAESFSRIFFRNAINFGLLAISHPEAARAISAGEKVTIDRAAGLIITEHAQFAYNPFPPLVEGILDAGGLDKYLSEKLG